MGIWISDNWLRAGKETADEGFFLALTGIIENAVTIPEAWIFFAYLLVAALYLTDGYLIKFSSEAVTDTVQKELGFGGENEEPLEKVS